VGVFKKVENIKVHGMKREVAVATSHLLVLCRFHELDRLVAVMVLTTFGMLFVKYRHGDVGELLAKLGAE
jgi:hypothetical protein